MSDQKIIPFKTFAELEKKYGNTNQSSSSNEEINTSPKIKVKFADELSEQFIPSDEILEDVFVAGEGSIIYGDSNSGKTFFIIDIACAISRGVPWMGRRTEQGLVVYLAAESPGSVERRLQAYRQHHNVPLENFAIIDYPVNLFSSEADVETLIQTIKSLEELRGQKVRLIVGDTLARLSTGANENAGQDMGIVMKNFDRIRTECNAHFTLIHHSGKNAAAGARGWSGVRAAVDTEIEITDTLEGKCAEITKQRNLESKGLRIGFKLEAIVLGLTKWNKPARNCVVIPADAPQKVISKRKSELAVAIIEHLHTCAKPVQKQVLTAHFSSRYQTSSIYREIKKQLEAGTIQESMGSIYITPKESTS